MTQSLQRGETSQPLHRARLTLGDKPRAPRWRRWTFAAPEPTSDRQIRIEGPDGTLAGTFRLRCVPNAEALSDSRVGQLWDLAPLAARPGPVVEFGDLRMRPDVEMSDVLGAAWAAVAAAAQGKRAGAILGKRAGAILGLCVVPGADPVLHAQALALLRADHVAPPEWLPAPRTPTAVRLSSLGQRPDRVTAVRGLPPLLRSWLGLGAWVAGHAVPDPVSGTLSILAILDPSRIPPARVRALHAQSPLA